MKRITALILSVVMLLSFAACSIGNTEDKKFADNIYSARVKNTEKTAEVKELIEVLNLQLRTAFCDVESSGSTVVLKFKESITDRDEFDVNIKKYATVLLALIKDAENIEWTYESFGKSYNGNINKNEATKVAGEDIKSYYSSKEKTKELLVNLEIARKNGSETKTGPTEHDLGSQTVA